MDKITCFIVEDDPQALDYAHSIVSKHHQIKIIGSSDSIKESADLIKKLSPDFLILDVFLKDGNAFEFLALFEEINFKIIFTTSYAKYAVDAFKFCALDYLLKPYEEKDLCLGLEKVTKEIKSENYQLQLQTLLQNVSTTTPSKKIVLKNADAINVIDISDIIYAKSDNNYTTFLIASGKEILVSKPLKSFEKQLSNYNFLRVHQSYLINLNQISSYDKRNEEIILLHTHAIPVAQSRKKELIKYIDTLF
ncbi:LytR/AlgR family response regulator transcription factor [Aquimarina pacifica]|uniref:LytR/AlgR family response regulator transcription factor n=1 Tax=Aquimarina pacifica TaxID=1296415 RepID=UPI00046E9721|nr:LytTR family DNA-binding domain-containing protein [Aquimarina pacifica]